MEILLRANNEASHILIPTPTIANTCKQEGNGTFSKKNRLTSTYDIFLVIFPNIDAV